MAKIESIISAKLIVKYIYDDDWLLGVSYRVRYSDIAIVILVIFFVTGFFLRVGLNEIHPTHPGNIKASDPVFHALAADYFAETGSVGINPPYLSIGFENVADVVPPGLTILSGSLAGVTGIESWNAVYFFACLFSALAIILMYLIADLLFGKTSISLLTAGLLVIPLMIHKWFYYLYIGMWPQNTVFTFVLFCIYLALKYFRQSSIIYVTLISIAMCGTFIVHYAELLFFFPFFVVMVYRELISKNTWLKRLIRLAVLGFPPFFILIISYANLIASRGVTTIRFDPSWSVDIPVFGIALTQLGVVYSVLSIIGLCLLVLNARKYSGLLAYVGFLFSILFIIPHLFIHVVYQTMRPRLALIFLLALLFAYVVYTLVISNMRIPRLYELGVVVLFVCIMFGIALSGYTKLNSMVEQQNIPLQRYDGYQWVEENTPRDSLLCFLGYHEQNGDQFTKRVHFRILKNKINDALQAHNRTDSLPLSYEGRWSGTWDWSGLMYRTGFFSTDHYEIPTYLESIRECDYTYIEFIPGMEQFAQVFAQYLTQEVNHTVAYQNNFALVLKNENRIS